jgi:ketosteroid isomerase-like protein
MKKTTKLCLLLTIASIVAFINPLQAQNAEKDMLAFAKKFQDTYNKKDDKGLKMMYTDDALRVNADGQSITGNAAISEEFAKIFADNELTIVIKQGKVVTNADGSLTSTGTYQATGTSKAGEKLEIAGNYNNTVIKINGHWKIAKSVLTAIQ